MLFSSSTLKKIILSKSIIKVKFKTLNIPLIYKSVPWIKSKSEIIKQDINSSPSLLWHQMGPL